MITNPLRSAALLLTSVLSIALFAPEWFGQTPGAKSKPETKEEKLKEAKNVVGGFIDLFDADVGPGEVDQRTDAFMKKFFGSGGAGVFEIGKKKYLVTVGEATLPFETKPGWGQRRIIALDRAELVARARMVELIESKVESGQLFELFQDYGAAVKPNIALMQEAQKKGALSAQRYKEATRSFAMGQVIGAVTIKTIEGMNGDQYKAVRILLWSPTLRDLAINTLLDSDYLLPLEKVADDDLDQISQRVQSLSCAQMPDFAGRVENSRR